MVADNRELPQNNLDHLLVLWVGQRIKFANPNRKLFKFHWLPRIPVDSSGVPESCTDKSCSFPFNVNLRSTIWQLTNHDVQTIELISGREHVLSLEVAVVLLKTAQIASRFALYSHHRTLWSSRPLPPWGNSLLPPTKHIRIRSLSHPSETLLKKES